jgi:hypothetical protein
MSALIGIKNPAEYYEMDNSVIVEKPAILNPVSSRWNLSRGNPAVDVKSGVSSPGYSMIPEKFYHPNPGRNALGLVGGNEVSISAGNLVDVESELCGITRSLSRVPAKNYRPSCLLGDNKCPSYPETFRFTERSSGKERIIPTKPSHLPTMQMFSYPGIPSPKPLVQQVYGTDWRL